MTLPTAVTIPSRVFGESVAASVAVGFTAAPTTPTAMTWLPGDILIAYNSSPDTAYTVTIVSHPKDGSASATLAAEAIAFGTYRVYPRFPPQKGGTLTVSASNAAVLFARISTAPQPS
jgi:hypothetical protein